MNVGENAHLLTLFLDVQQSKNQLACLHSSESKSFVLADHMNQIRDLLFIVDSVVVMY